LYTYWTWDLDIQNLQGSLTPVRKHNIVIICKKIGHFYTVVIDICSLIICSGLKHAGMLSFIHISDRTLCILLVECYELITSPDELEHLNLQLSKHACLEGNFMLLMIMETHL